MVRFIKADKSDVVPKIRRDWSTRKLVDTMVKTLEAVKKPVPKYLKFLQSDLNGDSQKADLKAVKNSLYKFLPMTVSQSNAVEEALKNGKDPAELLSPTQLKYLQTIKASPDKNWPDLTGVDFEKALNTYLKFTAK